MNSGLVNSPLDFPASLPKKEIANIYQTKAQSATKAILKPLKIMFPLS